MRTSTVSTPGTAIRAWRIQPGTTSWTGQPDEAPMMLSVIQPSVEYDVLPRARIPHDTGLDFSAAARSLVAMAETIARAPRPIRGAGAPSKRGTVG